MTTCNGVCGELGQRSVGTASPASRWAEGLADGPSGDLLAQDRGCSVPVCARCVIVCARICVRICVTSTERATWC